MVGGVTVDGWRNRSDSGWVEECRWMGGGVTVDGWRSVGGWVEE